MNLDGDKPKVKETNFVQQERDIHEAYQLILNEYYRKVKQRRKAIAAIEGGGMFGKSKTAVKNSALADNEEVKGKPYFISYCFRIEKILAALFMNFVFYENIFFLSS